MGITVRHFVVILGAISEIISGVFITSSTSLTIEGNAVNLTCEAIGSVFTRTWMKDGSELVLTDSIMFHDGNRVLSFSRINRGDSGEYFCNVSSPVSSEGTIYSMLVNHGPHNVNITGPSEIQLGKTLALSCSAESRPPASFTWKQNGTVIHNSAVFTKNITDMSDDGVYTCQAMNNVLVEGSTFTKGGLCRGAGILPDSLRGAVGDSVTFKTSVTPAAEPFLALIWSFNGTIDVITLTSVEQVGKGYENRVSLDGTTGSLVLSNLTENDSGTYDLMIIPHGAAPIQGSAKLDVYANVPKPTLTCPTENLIEGKTSVKLTCDSDGAVSARVWMKDGQPLVSGGRFTFYEGNRVLSVSPVHRNDTGEITCNVSNRLSSDIARCQLEVYYGPDNPIINQTPIGAELEDSVVLSCFANSLPKANFSWRFKHIQMHGFMHYIHEMRMWDLGGYTCTAKNAITGLEASAFHFLSGLAQGAGVLPETPLNESVGGSVMFTTTVTPTETPFFANTTGPEYEGRIRVFMSTGSLELRNLSFNDSGEYSLVITPVGAPIIQGSTRLTVYEPVSNVVLTASSTDLVEFNSTVRLSCSSYGSSLSFLWMNGSSEVTSGDRVQITDGGSTLTIVSVSRYDQGPFRCLVSNPVSDGTSGPVNLSISYGPENITLTSSVQEYTKNGSNVILSCLAVSKPPSQFYWFLNGDKLPDTGPELKLVNVQVNQNGNYSCQAFNQKTGIYGDSQPSPLTVLEIISGVFITSSTNLTIEGNAVNLTCEAIGSVFTRTWMKDGSELVLTDSIMFHDGNRVLSFSRINRGDSGEYFCNVSSPVSSEGTIYSMLVNHGPHNVHITGPSEIQLGKTLALSCSAESRPPASFTWKQNGTVIHNSAVFTKNITDMSDDGVYTCQAMNNVTGRTLSAEHKLTVTGRTSRSLSDGHIIGICLCRGAGILPDSLRGAVGDSVTFKTSVTPAGEPFLALIWSFNGTIDVITLASVEQVGKGYENRVSLDGTTGSLVLSNLTENDSGTYDLMVIPHGAAPIQGSAKLDVYANVPKPTLTCPTENLIEGKTSVKLTCDSDGAVSARVWMKDGQPLVSGGRFTFYEGNRMLSISPVHRNDTGEITCNVSNSLSSDIARCQLEVYYGPDNPIINQTPIGAELEDSVVLSCFANSLPKANFSWRFKHIQMHGFMHYIHEMRMWDLGGYTCTAKNAITGLEASAFHFLSDSSTPISGSMSILVCTVLTSTAGDMETSVKLLIVLGAISGFSRGTNVLPDTLTGAVGGTVMFKTTLLPSEIPFVVITWSFFDLSIITSSEFTNVTRPGYKDRITLFSSTASLELRNLTLGDNGEYSVVTVSNSAGTERGKCNLVIHEPVSNVVLTASSTDLVEFNSTVRLFCSSSGPSLSFLWMNGSSEVTSSDRVQITDGGSTLTIVSVSRYDQGPFRCLVSNPVSNVTSGPVNLSISFGPDKLNLTSPSPDYLRKGSNVTLSCSAASKPSAQFYWFLNGDKLPDTGPELKMVNLKLNQSGNYSCQAFNQKTMRYERSQPLVINVLEEVSNVTVNASATDMLESSGSVRLSCSSSGPSLSFLWMNGSSEVTASDRVQITDGGSTLTIVSVSRYDQGPFRCLVSNPVSNGTSGPVNLSISYGPEKIYLQRSPEQEYYDEGADVSLICSADSRPPALINWLLNGDKLSGTGAELRLTNIQMDQSGNYSCEAFNSRTLRNQTSQSVAVSVQKSQIANVVITTNTTDLSEFKSSVHLLCSASGSFPSFLWLNGSSNNTASERVQITNGGSILSIINVTRYDQGPFLCHVFNHFSKDTSEPLELYISFGPENVNLKLSPSQEHYEEGSNISLMCSADSRPSAQFYWFLSGDELPDTGPELRLVNVQISHSGNYSCQAFNNKTSRNESAPPHAMLMLHPKSCSQILDGLLPE
ncbi:hemicentin-1-like [Brachionichthys hirsutus]|uniref:hemicentin-1-like n=1 Tax=Brachionichthys hirsutus TaxID=412623 RepID=UPI003604AF7C